MLAALIWLAVYIIVIGLVFWLLNYLLDFVSLPEPFGRIARVLLVVVAVLIVIALLLQVLGMGSGLPKLGSLEMLYG